MERKIRSDEKSCRYLWFFRKKKMLPLIGQLEQEVTAARLRVDQLKKECPSDWSPLKNELDDLFGMVGSSVGRAWKDLEPGNVGG